jgi:drug/metabolite transporter (DMT)-like permease
VSLGSAASGHDRDILAGTVAAVVAASLFGMLGPLTRLAGDAGLPGIGLTTWRALLGSAFLLVLISLRGAARPALGSVLGLTSRGRASLAVACVAGFTLNVSMFTAFGLAPIALVLMLFYTYPAGVAIVDVALGHERVTRSRLAALGLSLGGVVLVLAGGLAGTDASAIRPAGVALGLLASACQVVFVTASRGGYRSVPADAATLVILGTAVVGSSVVAVVVGQGDALTVPLHTPAVWPFILLAGIAAAGISSLLFLMAIRRIGGTRTGILMLLEPVVGVLLAALLLGEALAPVQLLGAALVLLGALVLQRGSERDLEPVVETAAGPVV